MKVIHLLRKPCSEPTVAANVLKFGTGAINIDGCRVEGGASSGGSISGATALGQGSGWNAHTNRTTTIDRTMPAGRWPANLVLQHLDGCVQENCERDCPVVALDAQSGVTKSTGGRIGNAQGVYTNQGRTGWGTTHEAGDPGFGDTGGASRFFKQVSGKVGGED